jgi:hypothetical protein
VLLLAGAVRCREEYGLQMKPFAVQFFLLPWHGTDLRTSFISSGLIIKSTRVQRKANDKLAATREIWDRFVENCKDLSEPFEVMAVDEQLVAFRVKRPMR